MNSMFLSAVKPAGIEQLEAFNFAGYKPFMAQVSTDSHLNIICNFPKTDIITTPEFIENHYRQREQSIKEENSASISKSSRVLSPSDFLKRYDRNSDSIIKESHLKRLMTPIT